MARTASIWAMLTENLMSGDHLEKAAMDVLMGAEEQSNLADITKVAALDIDVDKLR